MTHTMIATLRDSRVQSLHVQRLLAKYVEQEQREAAGLRRFASHKAGGVADNCNAIADRIEASLAWDAAAADRATVGNAAWEAAIEAARAVEV
uniref:Uncharacterized protein n=1 Tax=viral metagenome TaxID=1070528 RepID=A0A6M3L038_9ZZZZ